MLVQGGESSSYWELQKRGAQDKVELGREEGALSKQLKGKWGVRGEQLEGASTRVCAERWERIPRRQAEESCLYLGGGCCLLRGDGKRVAVRIEASVFCFLRSVWGRRQ